MDNTVIKRVQEALKTQYAIKERGGKVDVEGCLILKGTLLKFQDQIYQAIGMIDDLTKSHIN